MAGDIFCASREVARRRDKCVAKNLKSLILVESAAKARTLKKFIGRSYNIISTDGFLKDMPKSKIGVDEEQNFLPNYITIRGKASLVHEIEKTALDARRIFLGMNPDAKGEFLAKQCCELFGVNTKSKCRVKFFELTKDAVKNAIENAEPIDEKLVNAFQAKQIIDKIVSHKIGEYLACKIYRGVKVGRFRALLLKLIAGIQPDGNFELNKKFTPALLQEISLNELKYSTPKTRLIVEQLYEGMNLEEKNYCGLIKYPYDEEIFLTDENRTPESVKEFLTANQFKLYELIYKKITDKNFSAKFELNGECSEKSLMATLDTLKIDWGDVYAVGISSLVKRQYVEIKDAKIKITELGEKVLSAVDEFFDELFSVESYNELTKNFAEIAEGKADKNSVIENYCKKFNDAFNSAMTALGDDAFPKDEPVIESDEVCEKCGRPMLIRRGRYGRFLACSGYPECKNAKPYVNYLEQKCPKCGGRITKRNLRGGKIFYGCENFPQCDFNSWDEPQEKPCKVCGSTMFIHRFKDRPPMIYCGNENCETRKNHPMNKILAENKRRYEENKARRENKKSKVEK